MSTKKGFEVVCKGVTFSPPEQPELKILNGVNLTIKQGEFLAIVGGNGTGKSTLLQAIAGEIELTSGSITVAGQDIIEPIHRRIDGVGTVHQHDDEDLLHAFSIAMNVAFRQVNNGCHPNKFWACDGKFRSRLAKTIGEIAPQLKSDMNKLVGHLSGGGRQMLNMVIAIHLEHEHNPCRLILLDEHTSKLDHTNSSELMNFTATQVEQAEATAIMVTHRYPDAIKYCDRIVVMGGGTIKKEFEKDKNFPTVEELALAVEKAA
jgi:putative ABC transport system ATP-binding protein